MNQSDVEKLNPTELNKAIALAKKWWVYHYDKDVESRCYYSLMDDSGDSVHLFPDNQRKTEEEAWADLPDWAGEWTRAGELLEEMVEKSHDAGVFVKISDQDVWRAYALVWGDQGYVFGDAEYGPLSIARCYLIYMQEIEELNKRYPPVNLSV